MGVRRPHSISLGRRPNFSGLRNSRLLSEQLFCHRLVHFLTRLLLLGRAQFLKRLCHLVPYVLQRCLHQLIHAFAAARASGHCGCERCQPSQPGFKHSTGMSLRYAVFSGFAAKAIASALVANHARSVPFERRQRFCEFIARFRFRVGIVCLHQSAPGAFDFCMARKPRRFCSASICRTSSKLENLRALCRMVHRIALQKARR